MPWRRLFDLMFPPQESVDMLSDMVISKAKTSEILSKALGYDINAVSDVVSGNSDHYVTLWLSLEMARRQVFIDRNLKTLRRTLKASIHAISQEAHPDYAVPLQRAVEFIDQMLDDSCVHDWVEVDNPINPSLPKGCVCRKCGSIKPAGAELPIASNDPGANI